MNQFKSGKIRTQFPIMRIKTIMKLDSTVGPVSRDAATLISFAAELFIQEIAARSWNQAEKRKTCILSKADVYQGIKAIRHFDFLADIVPYWEYLSPTAANVRTRRRRQSYIKKGQKNLKLEMGDDGELIETT